MITRYDFGTPIPTFAAVRSIQPEEGPVPRLAVTRDGEAVRFSFPLAPDTQLFGLGEQVRGMNKRGHIYRSWNSDDFIHTEDKQSLYGSHNFLLVFSPREVFGLFVDDPGEVVWDLGATDMDEMTVTSLGGSLSLYLVEGPGALDVCREFRGLIGESYLPPYWAFGYIQSRWGYAGEEDLLRVARAHREKGIPLDGICLDIDYMDHFRDFTLNPETVPDLPGLCSTLRDMGVHAVPIIDAGIPADPSDPASRSGVENDAFVKMEDGTYFQGAVWPGLSYFPDFLNSRAAAWFGDQYHPLLEAGLDGFWNDMNEPAIFYSREGIRKAYDTVREMDGKNLDVYGSWKLHGAVDFLANNRDDLKAFYHDMDGTRVRHDRVHNLYGGYMMRASMEGMHRFDPDRRFLLFSRSSYIGAHRYGGIWTGDNKAWWSHIRLSLQQLPGLNMCGFLYSGADIGGFGGDTTPDLLIRWLELGIFTPLMRNHTSIGTRLQEVYNFKNWEDMRNIITVRYALIPYLYSEFMKARATGGMLFRPLAFDYPSDPAACQVQDQLMLGGECMIAPVYEQNAQGRYVYLPETMMLCRLRSHEDYDLEALPAGHHWVPCALNEALLFIRSGCQIPFARGSLQKTADAMGAQLDSLGWENGRDYLLYTDDGVSYRRGTLTPFRGGRA